MTRPTPGMLAAMMSAEVGDDVFGEDPTINALEHETAQRFGKPAAIFCPSGTMTNQIAIHVHTRPGDEVVCSAESHIYNYEGGGIAATAGASVRLLGSGDRGIFTADEVREAIAPDDPHRARTRLVAVEDTLNRGGGRIWPGAGLDAIRDVCTQHELRYHLDGARVFNRIVAKGESPSEYAARFDTLSICLSKGLGAPVGSLLLGSEAVIHEARRVRKRLGGGMRQAGFLAAAGLYALEHHVSRLTEDHEAARHIADAASNAEWCAEAFPPDTNIVVCRTRTPGDATRIVHRLAEAGVLAVPMSGDLVRFVTHLDIDANQVDRACGVLCA